MRGWREEGEAHSVLAEARCRLRAARHTLAQTGKTPLLELFSLGALKKKCVACHFDITFLLCYTSTYIGKRVFQIGGDG
jgi:hypothetical protein